MTSDFISLTENGYGIGLRVIEYVGSREKSVRRETRIVDMLQYLCNTIWKHLFNKTADNLQRSTENEDECQYGYCIICYAYSYLLACA